MKKREIVNKLREIESSLASLLFEIDICEAKGCDDEASEVCEGCGVRVCIEHSTPDADGECRFCAECVAAWAEAAAEL